MPRVPIIHSGDTVEGFQPMPWARFPVGLLTIDDYKAFPFHDYLAF